MKKRRWLPLLILCIGALALWPCRDALTAEGIAARSPRQAWLAAVFLLALYGVKSLSVAFPLSALEAAGGLLFPFPAALAVNLCGVAVAQAVPYLLGGGSRTAWRRWRTAIPDWRSWSGQGASGLAERCFCCGWRGHPLGTL